MVGLLLAACEGEHLGPGTPVAAEYDREADIARRGARQQSVAPAGAKQVLFGDLHVHTTFSPDAFVMSLPFMGGEGVHPPADACDYARYCAALDFWSINDHAEGISPQHWSETIDAIQQCNAVAGSQQNPDTVAFLGWEWSQVGNSAETHYGHKNVIFRDTDRDAVPRRPIAAPRPEFRVPAIPLMGRILLPALNFGERQRYFDYFQYTEEVEDTPACPAGVGTRELPDSCHEVAQDPADLFARLAAWDTPSMVIPHGTSWGLMAPPGSSWDVQRQPDQRSPQQQNLLEIYSGHGSSEVFRPWRAVAVDDSGAKICPAPVSDYEPCCWRAGEIIRRRCERDMDLAQCEARVRKARSDYLAAGVAGHYTVPGTSVEDWGVCGQCTDCTLPAYQMRPGMSAQYALASGFRFGFIGASDTHVARAGNGFKEHARRRLTESKGPVGRAAQMLRDTRDPAPESVTLDIANLPIGARRYTERGSSFLLTGGLAAVHAAGRDRRSIWDALQRREVYATSGERILLWFDLLNAPGGAAPMGAEVQMAVAPRFRVSAVGAYRQRPGCPEYVTSALSPQRTRSLCLDECYSPSDRRRVITRIEVVRISPVAAGEAGDRIEDPWRVLPCPDGTPTCTAAFTDPDYVQLGAEVAYYVRAIQEPTEAVNAGGLRCETDERGNCVRVRPCYGDDRTGLDDDCLAEVEERAWSSPIFLTPATDTSGALQVGIDRGRP